MKLDLSDSQTLLKETAARLFAEKSTPAGVREAERNSGFDPKLWQAVVSLGLVGMRAASSGESSLLDAALVAEEAGRHLASVPLVEGMIAAALLERAGASMAERTTEVAIRAAEVATRAAQVATLALKPVVARESQLVPGGAVASLVLALDGDALVAIERAGVAAVPASSPSPVAMIDLAAERGERIVLASGQAAQALHAAAIEEWKLLSAASLAGMARRALELAGAYSCERIQFGRPIGSFQGVAHPLADSATDIDGAELLIRRAIWAIAEGRGDASESIAAAWWWA